METLNVAPITPKSSFFINRNFSLLWIGQAVSDFGDTIYLITLNLWIATVIARNQPWAPLAISGEMIAIALPALLISPLAGVLVDRWDKRRTMILMDILRAILLLLLIPLTGLIPSPLFPSHPSPLWQIGSIYAIVLLASLCGLFFSPARFTIISEIVPEALRPHASAIEQTSSSTVKIIGPFLAAPLLFVVGVQWALLVNALSFVVSFIAISAVRPPADLVRKGEESSEKNSFFRELQAGLIFYKENRLIQIVLISLLIVTLGTGALDVLLVFFFQTSLHASTNLYGTLPMAVGGGSILGAILAALLVKRLGTTRVFWLSFYVIGLVIILFTLQDTLWPALIILFMLGLPLGAVNTAIGPMLMHIIPHPIMGRVMSVFGTGQTVCNLLSITLAGVLGTLFVHFHTTVAGIAIGGYSIIYFACGLLFLLGGLFAMLNLRHVVVA